MHRLYFFILVLSTIHKCYTIDGTNNELLPKPNECGVLNTEYFYNGQNTSQIDEFPWMATIGYNDSNASEIQYLCLAVLISKQYLLSHAHCLDRPNGPEAFVVVLGDWNASNSVYEQDCDANGRCAPKPVQLEIEEIVIHPNSSTKRLLNDIALLRLKQAVDFSDYIRPICLPSAHVSSMDFVAQHLTITGWTRERGLKTKEYVLIYSLKECSKLINTGRAPITIANMKICANVCDQKFGDTYLSGSTLMGVQVNHSEADHYYIVGLDAFGSYKCLHRIPDVFVRVDAYLNWIVDNIY